MPFTLAAPQSEVEPSRPQEFPRTSTTSTTNTNAVTGTLTNTNHYPQRQRNSCSALGHMLRTNSMVRYGTLIFLIALISVLYFATTHQVLKPTGVGPTIIIDVFTYNPSKPPTSDEFLSADGSSIQPYDTYESSTKGNVQQIVEGSLHNNTVTPLKGALYDRGDGCQFTTPPFGDSFNKFKIGLISSDITNCPIKQKVDNSLADKDLAIIFKLNNPDDVAGLDQGDYGITIFTIDKLIGDILSEKMQNLPTQTDSTSVLVATLSPYRQLIVSSWLFAMFAVGGILVASFFVSILIHMRLYRLRRNQQDEVRRQRAADEVLGMKKWTLEKEVIDTFPIIIYKNSIITTEVSEAKPPSTSDDLDSTSDAVKQPGNGSAEQNENSEPTSTNQQLHRSTSTRSTRSIRSTRSTKSTRTLNAINNATNLYNSTTTPTSPTSPTTPITPITPITPTTSAAVDGASTTDDNEVEACAICIEDFAEGDELRLLPCKHWYHVECIDPWLTTKSSSCPLCKTDCRPSQFDEIVIDSPVNRPPIRDNNIESERSNNTNIVIRMGRAAGKLFGGRRGTSVRPSNTQPPQNDNNDSTVVELEMENVNSSRTREE